MTWQLGLDFMARISWPIVVITLGLIFRKPLRKFISNLSRLKFGGMEAETDVSDRTEDAAARLLSAEDNQTDQDNEAAEAHGSDESDSASAQNENQFSPGIDWRNERSRNIVNGGTQSGAGHPRRRISPVVANLLVNNPAAAIQVSAIEYGDGILEILRVLEVEPSEERKHQLRKIRGISIHVGIMREACDRGILTEEEFEASRDLARAVKTINSAKGQIDVDRETAREFATMCAALRDNAARRSWPMIQKAIEAKKALRKNREAQDRS